jgi:hypothetical protein
MLDETKKDEAVVVTLEENVADVPQGDELSPMELELAKKHEVKVEEKPKVEEKKAEEKKPEPEIPLEDLDSFEKLHDLYQAKPDAFYKLPKNIKQLYHSQKGLYKRMKEEEEKRKSYEDDAGLKKIQESVARIKLDRIKSRLANPEGLTVEEMQELIDEKKETQNDDKPLTKKDLEEFEASKKNKAEEESQQEIERKKVVFNKIKSTEEYAIENIADLTASKYDNFDDVVALAQDVMKSKARYATVFNQALNGEANEQEIAEIIVDIAKLSPKWGESVKTEKKNDEAVDKLVKNSTKQQTSATLTGGRGTRDIHISEDMDPEDAAKVWDKIPRDMRHKILRKVH